MSDYYRKLVEGIAQNDKESASKANVFQRLSNIENSIARIDDIIELDLKPADINSFNTAVAALGDAKTAIDRIPNAVEEAKMEITSFFNEKLASAEAKLKLYADNAAAAVSEAAEFAKNVAAEAKNIANQAKVFAQNFLDRLKFAADHLKADIGVVKIAAQTMITVLIRELKGIGKSFETLGLGLITDAEGISTAGTAIFTQLSDYVKSLKEKGRYIKNNWLDELPGKVALDLGTIGEFIWAPWNLAMATSQMIEVLDIQKPYLPSHDRPVVKDESMMWIFRKGLSDFRDKLDGFSNSIGIMAGNLKDNSVGIGTRVNLAKKTIEASFRDFTQAFYKMFWNLQFTLLGQEPPAEIPK